ncbi:MAG: TetR/AcrR family transcriptional regulator [Sulfitobacter sp.]
MKEDRWPAHPRKLGIVHAAVICVLEKGITRLANATSRDIVHQADVSLGNLYSHFMNMEGVLACVADIEGAKSSPFIDLPGGPGDPRAA